MRDCDANEKVAEGRVVGSCRLRVRVVLGKRVAANGLLQFGFFLDHGLIGKR